MHLDIAQEPTSESAHSGAGHYQDGPGTGGDGALQSEPAPSLALSGALDSEAIALNLEASLRIYNDRHLFAWTQGLLQGLLRHEVLICQMRNGDDGAFEASHFSTDVGGPESFDKLCRHEASFADGLIRDWQAQHYQAVMRDIDGETLSSENVLQMELLRQGASRVIGHGTYDAGGRTRSFFLFACRPEEVDARHPRLVEMLVPFLHSAWMRTRVNLAGERVDSGPASAGQEVLTQREQEVLKWMYLGKSNIEIGLILGISPLTVKNHVQEILRRLDVQNRAQAVGKAFKLHILSC